VPSEAPSFSSLTVSLRYGCVINLSTYDLGGGTSISHPGAGASCMGTVVSANFPTPPSPGSEMSTPSPPTAPSTVASSNQDSPSFYQQQARHVVELGDLLVRRRQVGVEHSNTRRRTSAPAVVLVTDSTPARSPHPHRCPAQARNRRRCPALRPRGVDFLFFSAKTFTSSEKPMATVTHVKNRSTRPILTADRPPMVRGPKSSATHRTSAATVRFDVPRNASGVKSKARRAVATSRSRPIE
jgi:hypothetical protein